jgi:radical SAM superfamily enzyme YgiQ (UPF0313 family)
LVLLNPPKFHQVWAGVPDVFNDQRAHIYPPMGLMQLSAFLKATTGHEIFLVDAQPDRWSHEETTKRVLDLRPDVVGITATTHAVCSAATMARGIRRAAPGVRLLLGGPHVSAFPDHALAVPEFDMAVRGDAERPVAALLDRLAGGGEPDGIPGVLWRRDGAVVDNGVAEPWEDLDALPLPDRDGLPHHRYYTPANIRGRTSTLMGSRGCPNQCVFCNVPHKFRARSAAHIVDEMAACRDRHGIEEIHFIDDLFNSSVQRVIDISEEILRRGVKMLWGFKASCRNVTPEMLRVAKRAGCYRIHYGVETHSNEGLQAINKKLDIDRVHEVFRMTREAGVVSIAYMMVGCPHERSPEDVLRVIPFIRRLDPNYVVYSLFTPYPDTEIFRRGAEIGLWEADVWIRFMRDPRPGTKLPTVWTQWMNEDTLLDLFKRVNRAFYFHPRVLFRTVRSISGPAHLARIVRGGLSVARLQLIPPGSGRI